MNIRKQFFVGTLFLLSGILIACGPAPQQSVDQQAIIEKAIQTIEARQTVEPTPDSQVTQINMVGNTTAAGFELQDTLINLYDTVNPSVVFIGDESTPSAGSGFVYDIQGHIVTNNHVVDGLQQLYVRFADGQQRSATVVGADVDSDLAVIRVDDMPAGILPVPMAESGNFDVGQFVIAIGNPFGEEGSMSLGIISAMGRGLPSQRSLSNGVSYSFPQVIQTDASINPGNSGGPLLNLNGEVIGVNAAILSPSTIMGGTPSNSGVGYSIPVDAVNLIVPELIANGYYSYPFMGVSYTPLSVEGSRAYGFDREIDTFVTGMLNGGPAYNAGVQVGDIILAFDGTEVSDFNDLNSYLTFYKKPGDVMQVTVLRDGIEVSFPMTLGKRE